MEQTNEEGNLTSIDACFKVGISLNEYIQSNLSTTGTLGTKESGRCGEVAVVERWPLWGGRGIRWPKFV